MDFKLQIVDEKLLFHCVALGVREVRIVDFPRQSRNLRAAILRSVFQPFLLTLTQTAHGEIHEAGNRLPLCLFSSGQHGAGFADVRCMALPGKLFVGFVLTANLAVVTMWSIRFLSCHEHHPYFCLI